MNPKHLRKLDKDELLNLLGLQSRRGPSDVLLPALGAFTVGVLVGAGLGLLLAPKPGPLLRDDLARRLKAAQEAEGAGAKSTETPSAIASGSRTL